MKVQDYFHDVDDRDGVGDYTPSKQELREIYQDVLERNRVAEGTPFEMLPYDVSRQLESYGIYDDSFLKDKEESLKNEVNSDKMKRETSKKKINRIYGDGSGGRIYGDGRYDTRQNGRLVDEFGENQDNGYNFDEFDM